MPITITQALDLPVAVVLLMFIPIGLWRGALREWVACAGIALGTLLAGAAGGRWGEGFAQLANMDPKLGSFTVATGFFLTSVLLIGYGGGVALPYRPDLSWTNRGLGALVGLGNGLLIMGGLLRLMQERLFDGRSNSPLHTTTLTAFLIDGSIIWVYLGLFLSLLLCVILGLVWRVNGSAPLFEEYSPDYRVAPQGNWDSAAQRGPERLPAETRSADAAAPISATSDQETQVLRLVTAPAGAKHNTPQVANLARPTPRATTTAPARHAERTRDIERVPLTSESMNGHDGPTSPSRPMVETTTATGKPHQRESMSSASVISTGSCPICDAPLAAMARFCSNCGHITGAAEQRQIARQR